MPGIGSYDNIINAGIQLREQQEAKRELEMNIPDLEREAKDNIKYLSDSDFQYFQNYKYGGKAETYSSSPDYIAPKSRTEQDYEEYVKRKDDFVKTTEKVNKISGAHIPLAWTMRNIDNKKARSMAKPFATLEDAKANLDRVKFDYDTELETTALKYGVTPDSIKEWQGRTWRGFLTGTTEVLNDMRDTLVKSAIPAGVTIATSAGVGAVTGGVPGAVAGVGTGLTIVGKTAVPLATLQDTAVKEYGSLMYEYLESHPDISEKEFQALKKAAAVQSLVSGTLEAGVAAIALPYVGKVAMNIPGAEKITSKVMGKGAKEATSNVSKWLSTETGKEFLKGYSKLVGAEITQEEIQQALSISANEYANRVGMAELEQQMENLDGVLIKGNIDISNRPKHVNADGSVSTVASMSVTLDDGKALLLSTVTEDGKMMTQKEAIRYYEATGKHLGVFENLDVANEYADLLHRQQARYIELATPSSVAEGLGKAAVGTIQGVGLIGIAGVGGSIRADIRANQAKAHVQMSNNINKQIDSVNAQEGFVEQVAAQEAPKLEGRVEMNVGLEDQTSEQLAKTEAEGKVRSKELDNQISTTEARIENAEALGIDQDGVAQLKQQVENLNEQKTEQENYMRQIGTEKAIRQAQEQTEANLEKVNAQLEDTESKIETLQSKIETAKKENKNTAKLEEGLSKLQTKLENLEARQEKLLGDKAKLENREDVESVLKGKTTKISSTTLVNIEKQAEEAIARADAKAAAKLNKQMQRTAEAEIAGKIKEIKARSQGQTRGFLFGSKEQIARTKEVRRSLAKALRDIGIKKSERGEFDAIAKNILDIPDLVKYQKAITEKVKQVFEKREKAIALKLTKRLYKLSRPFKGKAPKGKMTAAIQNKVNRLFAFANKSFLEAQLDIEAIVQKFSANPDERLAAAEKADILIADNNAKLVEAQRQINDIENSKEPKQQWKGRDKNREGKVTDVADAVGYFTYGQKVEESPEILGDVKNILTASLNLINLGIKFKDLTVSISDNVAEEGMFSPDYSGVYHPKEVSLEIIRNAVHSIPHELGHYFDAKLNELFGDSVTGKITTNPLMKLSPRAAKIVGKLNKLIDAEISRVKDTTLYRNLSKENKEYITMRTEVFARIFNAMYNKTNGIDYTATEITSKLKNAVNELTKSISDTTLKEFANFLNDVAEYQNTGVQLDALDQEIARLEEENKKLETDKKLAVRLASERGLPETVAELVDELSIAYDLASKTAAEIDKFNAYVAQLIQEGRDARAEKLAQQKEQRDNDIEQAVAKLLEFAPERGKKGELKINWAQRFYASSIANLQSILNLFCGKMIAEKFNLINNDIDRIVFSEKETTAARDAIVKALGVKNYHEVTKFVQAALSNRMTVTQIINDKPVKKTINQMQALCAWLYNQNEIGQSRLEKMFGENLDEVLAFADTPQLKSLGRALMSIADKYYEPVNKIFSEDRGIDLPRRQSYFPFITEGEITDIPSFMESAFGTHSALPSFTKTVTKSSGVELKLVNPIAVIFNHIQNVSEYVNMYPKTKYIEQVFGSREFRANFIESYGEGAWKNFRKILDRVAAKKQMNLNTDATKLLDKLASNYVVSKIALKPTIAFKQLLSFINYAEGMPVKTFMKYQVEFWANPKKAIDFMMKDEYVKARFSSGREVFEMANALEESTYAKTGRIMDLLTLNVRVGDIGAILVGGYSQVQYLIKEKGLSQQEAFREFEKSTADSQQFTSDSSISNLQAYAKDNALCRMLFAFTNTPYQYARKIVDSTIQVARGEISKAEYSKTVMIYQVLNPLLYNMATSLSPMALLLAAQSGDEDEMEEAAKELIVNDFLGGILTGNTNLAPIIGDVPTSAYKLATGQSLYRPDTIPLEQEKYMIMKSIGEVLEGMRADDFEDIDVELFLETAQGIGEIAQGLPIAYGVSAATGATQLIDEETRLQGALRLFGYSARKSKAISGNED